jgi:hypothetical protein
MHRFAASGVMSPQSTGKGIPSCQRAQVNERGDRLLRERGGEERGSGSGPSVLDGEVGALPGRSQWLRNRD